MKKFLLALLTFLLLSPLSSNAEETIEDNGIIANLESGSRVYQKQMGIYMYTQVFKLTNTNADKYVESCQLYYSLIRSNGSVALSANTNNTPSIAPKGDGYGKLWLAQDSQVGPSGLWSRVKLDKLQCSPTSNEIRNLKVGAPLIYKMGNETIKFDAIYSEIVITNTSESLVKAFANVAIVSPTYGITGTTILSGQEGCYSVVLAPKQSITCQIVRQELEPFLEYQINWTRYGQITIASATPMSTPDSNSTSNLFPQKKINREIAYKNQKAGKACKSSEINKSVRLPNGSRLICKKEGIGSTWKKK